VNGFLVEKPPTLEERFTARWSDQFSLPYFDDEGQIQCKPVVYFDREAKLWGLRFNGVYNSEFLVGFESANAANNVVRAALALKSQ